MRITTGGQVSNRIRSSDHWYRIFGGIVDIDLSEISSFTMKLLLKSRIGIVNEYNMGVNHWNVACNSYFPLFYRRGEIYLAEYPFGINSNFIDSAVTRLNVGEALLNHVFVSSYGKPVRNVHVNLYLIEGELANNVCYLPTCNRYFLLLHAYLQNLDMACLQVVGNTFIFGLIFDWQPYRIDEPIRHRSSPNICNVWPGKCKRLWNWWSGISFQVIHQVCCFTVLSHNRHACNLWNFKSFNPHVHTNLNALFNWFLMYVQQFIGV